MDALVIAGGISQPKPSLSVYPRQAKGDDGYLWKADGPMGVRCA